MFGRIIRISFDYRNGCREDQHIAGFFDRHIAAVGLSVSLRIRADIV